MIAGLHAASNLLSIALERYIATCSAIADCYDPSHAPQDVSIAISEAIPAELEVIFSHTTKLKQAQLILSQTRNIIPTIAPVTLLPPDILVRVFRLVQYSQPCFFADQHDLKAFPLRYPEALSHVCSRWRQVALSSSTLWRHIDVPPQSDASNVRLLARAEIFATRAGLLPLDIHIIGQTSNNSTNNNANLNTFYTSTAPRMRSLELSAHRSFDNPHLSVLQYYFKNCVPGELNQLVLTGNRSGFSFDMIVTSETVVGRSSRVLDLPHKHLEDCLLPVRILRLAEMYFDWTSRAYHGLVELHLVPQKTRSAITQPQLMGILASSPGLRVLHFGLEIRNLLSHDASPVSARLNDLEVLNLRTMNGMQCGTLLRLITPGLKPLRLSVNFCFATFSTLFSDEFKQFFNRSHVTELYIQAHNTKTSLTLLELFETFHVPGLQSLSLSSLSFLLDKPRARGYELSHVIDQERSEPLPTCSQLTSIHLASCDIDTDHLRRMTTIIPIRTMTLAGCRLETDECEQKILKFVPNVKFLPGPRSLEEWDPWD